MVEGVQQGPVLVGTFFNGHKPQVDFEAAEKEAKIAKKCLPRMLEGVCGEYI